MQFLNPSQETLVFAQLEERQDHWKRLNKWKFLACISEYSRRVFPSHVSGGPAAVRVPERGSPPQDGAWAADPRPPRQTAVLGEPPRGKAAGFSEGGSYPPEVMPGGSEQVLCLPRSQFLSSHDGELDLISPWNDCVKLVSVFWFVM